MHHTNKMAFGKTFIILIALIFQNPLVMAKTIYSVPFDYHRFESSDDYFHGRSKDQIEEFCKTQADASNEDSEQCEHREFETKERELNMILVRITRKVKEGDVDLKSNDDPVALPYFFKAQDKWMQYRDDYCYSRTYAIGEASARYIYFWSCMKDITADRTRQLKSFFDN